jgi:hypothetical protein
MKNCVCGSPPDILYCTECPRCGGAVDSKALYRRRRLALDHAKTSLAAYHRRSAEADELYYRLAREFPGGPEPRKSKRP